MRIVAILRARPQFRQLSKFADGKIWIIALVILCSGILGLSALYSESMPYSLHSVDNFASLAGECLVYALVAWGVFYFAFLRGKGGNIGFSAYVSIFFAFFVGGLVWAEAQKQQAAQAVAWLQQEVNRTVDTTRSGEAQPDTSGVVPEEQVRLNKVSRETGLPTRPIEGGPSLDFSKIDTSRLVPEEEESPLRKQPVPAPTGSGAFAKAMRVMKEFLDRADAISTNYSLETQSMLAGILSPMHIRNGAGLSESKAIVEDAKNVIRKHEKKQKNLIKETRDRIESLDIPERSKEAFLSGFDKGFQEYGRQIDQNWHLERQVLQQLENILLLLEDSENWTIENGEFLFYNQEERARFQSYIQSITAISQKQEQLQAERLTNINKDFNSLKGALHR